RRCRRRAGAASTEPSPAPAGTPRSNAAPRGWWCTPRSRRGRFSSGAASSASARCTSLRAGGMTISPELRELAETPDRFTQLSSDVERFADERVCLVQGLTWASVSGVNVEPDDLEALVAEMR